MKKYIVIGLIVLVGGAYLYSLLKPNEVIEPVDVPPAAEFAFEENLATRGNEVAPLEIKVNEDIAELQLFYNDSLVMQWENVKKGLTYPLEAGVFGVGTRTLSLISTTPDGAEFSDNRFIRVLSDIIPQKLVANIVNEYPHDNRSFTQGLEFYDGKLYEGTGDPGNQGRTLVAEVNVTTGEHLGFMGLNAGYFGEGITLLNDKLYQLTYKNGKCYVYDRESLEITGEFNYQGEGWGLCNDGAQLIMSNGTERIVFRDPATFTTIRTIDVYNNEGPITNLNELEYIDGKIYANIWTSNVVVVIDPMTGKVLQEIDASELVLRGRGRGEVLNGIAIDRKTGKIYMTGKYWDKLFEVRFAEPGV